MRKFLRYILFIVVSAFFLALVGFPVAVATTTPTVATLPPLKNGDLVFQTNPDPVSLAEMYGAKTLYSHVGMIKIAKDGKPLVVEVTPVHEIPLQEFIDRGLAARVEIRRIRNLKPEKAERALEWAKQQYGKPYDFFFLPDTKRFYCSELVEDSFKNGANITLGKYQKVGDLNSSFAMNKIIETLWRQDPVCRAGKSMTYDKCRAIIMQQTLITPASIARDPRLQLVYSNYP